MNTRLTLLGGALAALTLSGCGSSGNVTEGLSARVTAVPQGSAPHAHGDEVTARNGGATKSFRRSDGLRIDLQLGLFNLAPVELRRCGTDVSRVLEQLSPIASAQAHGGGAGEEIPAGLVSVTDAAVEAFDLGEFPVTPGTYCGAVFEIRPGEGTPARHGGELDPSMAGALVNVAPCAYAGTESLSDADAAAATAHRCFQAKVGGEEREVVLPFATPVTLDKDHRTLDLTVAARYEEWFEGIDMNRLASDEIEQQKLADNVAASLHLQTGDEQAVALNFQIKVNGQEALCGQTYDGLGIGEQRDLRLEGFRFYASDFTLENASGAQAVTLKAKPNQTVLQDTAHGIALLGHTQGCDAPTRVRNLSLAGTVPKGEYERLCFSLGVPYEQAHSDLATAPSPLNVTGMDWSWLFGRMFLRVDTVADPDGAAPAPFFLHLGSTGCSNGATPEFGAPPTEECVYPNRPRVCLDYAQIEDGHAIVADIAPLVSELDILHNTEGTVPGCMSFPEDPECVTVMPQYGLDYALAPPALVPRREQTLFTVAP